MGKYGERRHFFLPSPLGGEGPGMRGFLANRQLTSTAAFCPGGTIENSAAVHCWEAERRKAPSPGGTAEPYRAEGFSRPFGTSTGSGFCPPSDESLGYFQMSLRDKNIAIQSAAVELRSRFANLVSRSDSEGIDMDPLKWERILVPTDLSPLASKA